jgi:hypothetical protein
MRRGDAQLAVLTVLLCSPCYGFLLMPYTQRAALSCSSPFKRASTVAAVSSSQSVALRAKYDDYELGLDDGAGPPRKRTSSSSDKRSSPRRTTKQRDSYTDDELFGKRNRYDRDDDSRWSARSPGYQSTARSDFLKSIPRYIGFGGALYVALGIFVKPVPPDPAIDTKKYDGQPKMTFNVEPEPFVRGILELKMARITLVEALELTKTDMVKAGFTITTSTTLQPSNWRKTCIFFESVLPPTDKHNADIKATCLALYNDVQMLFDQARAKKYDNYAATINQTLAGITELMDEVFYRAEDNKKLKAAAAAAGAAAPQAATAAAAAPAVVAPAPAVAAPVAAAVPPQAAAVI